MTMGGRHSTRIPFSEPIDFVDVVAGYLAARRFHQAGDIEENVKSARLAVKHFRFDGIVSENQSSGLWAKAVDVSKVTCLRIASLIQLQRLVGKSRFLGDVWGKQVAPVGDDCFGDRPIHIDVWPGNDRVIVASHGDGVSIIGRAGEDDGVLDRPFRGAFGFRVRQFVQPVIRDGFKQADPVLAEGFDNLVSDRRDDHGCASDVGQYRINASFGYPLDAQTPIIVSSEGSVFVADRCQGGGKFQEFNGPFVLKLDAESLNSLGHLLGPLLFARDDTAMVPLFNAAAACGSG
ncbi:hypothetical protein [Novosphingobium sp.]|uniref:hypothetical protein n=1 Tax=Novosphingobium sp. TaxID=1874826 RepID=UPI003D11F40C